MFTECNFLFTFIEDLYVCMNEPSHLYGKIIFYHVFLASLVEMICLVICEREEVTQELATLDLAGKRI